MIRYDLLHSAQTFYEKQGYKFVETPWTVPNEIMSITYYIDKADNPFYLKHKDKSLVASGEQGFLSLYNKGFLPKGKFQTTTPCFRDETFDEIHTKYFMKNELIITEIEDAEAQVHGIVGEAYRFFSTIVPFPDRLKFKFTGDLSQDIYYDDIEIGSYGYRECSYLKWIYGTGLAEPRFSRAIGE